MLGVATNPTTTPADEVMREVAEQMGVGATFTSTPVGVFYGEPGVTVPDPYFGGVGPERTGCTECGSCMTGCRVGGKNTLVKNYLYLAEKAGAVVHPLTTVTGISPRPGGGWEVETVRSGAWRERRTVRRWTCDHVVLAAGTYGTQRLLHAMRDGGTLPRLSPRLGHQTRTNSEAVLGARARKGAVDYSQGVAITSSFHIDEHTHVEPVRYGKGSNAIGLLQTVLVDGGGRFPRWLKALGVIARNPAAFLRSLSVLPLVGADRHRAGHAEPGQQPGRLRPPPATDRCGADHPARPGRAEPDVDPRRPRGGPPDGRHHRRRPRRRVHRARRHPADRPFPRRLCHRRDRGGRASSTPTTGCTAIPASRSWTVPPSRRTSASTRR